MTLCCGRMDSDPLPSLLFVRTTPVASAPARSLFSSGRRHIRWPVGRHRSPCDAIRPLCRLASVWLFIPGGNPSACSAFRTPRDCMRCDTSSSSSKVSAVNASSRAIRLSPSVRDVANVQLVFVCLIQYTASGKESWAPVEDFPPRTDAGEVKQERYCGLGKMRERMERRRRMDIPAERSASATLTEPCHACETRASSPPRRWKTRTRLEAVSSGRIG